MRKSLLVAASVATMTLAMSQAFAQTKNFEGFSVGLNYSNVRTEQTITTPTTSISSSLTDGYASLQAQYTLALNAVDRRMNVNWGRSFKSLLQLMEQRFSA